MTAALQVFAGPRARARLRERGLADEFAALVRQASIEAQPLA